MVDTTINHLNQLEAMISIGKSNGLQKEMAIVEKCMPIFKTVTGTDAATYLGFNTPASSQIKFSDTYYGNGEKFISEWSAQTDKPNGRGIYIGSDGEIRMKQWKDGKNAAGPCIDIWSDGSFDVGEYYYDANWGGIDSRGTRYDKDGTKKRQWDSDYLCSIL